MSKMKLGIKEEQNLFKFVTKLPTGTKVNLRDIKKIISRSPYNKAIYHVNHFSAMAPGVVERKGLLRDGSDWYVVDITKENIDDLYFGTTVKNDRVRNYYKNMITEENTTNVFDLLNINVK